MSAHSAAMVPARQSFPGSLKRLGAMEVVPVDLPIWVMVIPMLMKIDFGVIHRVR